MKSLLTLCGWVVVGAVIAFGGQQVWKSFKKTNPDRSAAIAEKVSKTLDDGAEVIRETADAMREEIVTPEPVAEPEPVVDVKTPEDAPAAVAEKEAIAQKRPTIGKPVPLDRDKTVEERLYKIASGEDEAANELVADTVVERESAAEYEQRQDSVRRKEEVLMQRQMRIVDELTSE